MSNRLKKGMLTFLLLVANVFLLFGFQSFFYHFPMVGNIPWSVGILLLLMINLLAAFLIIRLNDFEDLCTLMLNNIDELVLIFDCQKRQFTSANQLGEKLGYQLEEISYLSSLRKIVYPDDINNWEQYVSIIREKIKTGDFNPYRAVNRFLSKKGEVFYLETNSIPLKKGNKIKVVITARNITKHVTLAQNLQASEKQYREIVENSYDCIYSFDVSGIFTFVNQSFKRHTGLESEKFIGTNCLDWVHPDDRPAMLSVMENITKGPVSFRFRMYQASGQVINFRASNWPVFDDNGNLLCTMGTAVNVDRDIELEKRFWDFEKKYRSLYCNAQVGLITTRMDGSEIIMANNKFAEMLGYDKPSELEGKPLTNIWANPRERDDFIQLLKNQQSIRNYPARAVCKDGQIKELELFARYDPAMDYIETNLIDISEILKAREKAEAANLAKDQFLANISHEIRTPMIGILGSVDLLEQSRLTPEQSANLSIIRECGEHLLTIINEILDVSKIELGLLTLNPEACNLLDLFTKTTRIAEPLFKEKGLKLILNLDRNIPDQVLVDQSKLRQVLLNILYNAVKFTNQGIIIIDTHIQINQESFLLVSISDTGIGIPQCQQNKIFEAFTQGDSSTSREFGGTGSGLYICKKIIDLMEGNIWLDSCEGKGTIFHFKIPLEIIPAGEVVIDQPEPVQENECDIPILEFNPVKVLIVEDNALTQKIVGQMLSNYGFEVSYASNGLECLKVLSENQIDMVLMDMQMPLMDGYETTRFIRDDSELKNLPVIAMTAHAMTGDREKCLASGCSNYITKPFKSEELVQLIKKHLTKDLHNLNHVHNGRKLINELMPEFIANLQEMIRELDLAIQSKNYETLRSVSHDIKGTAGMYGFMEISEIAASLEQAVQNSSYQQINILYNQINNLFHQANTKVS
ncbi:MAG: PAS domain S-box protein [Syntrophomonas sp.]